MQLITGASSVQKQYNNIGASANADNFFFEGNGANKAVLMQDQMHQKRAQSTIRVQANRDMAGDKNNGKGQLAKGKTTGRPNNKT